jgi:hydrogenase large subunit
LDIQITVDTVNGQQQIVDAQASGTMFRGFEAILKGRDPRDAGQYTQRVCGVCPISHGMAACLGLEQALGQTVPTNGRILRNLVLGANYLQSHILHFYHLAAPDYINTTGKLDMAPWTPRFVTPDMVTGATADTLISHYVQALGWRRQAHRMGAIFGGKMPAVPSFVAGGCSETVTSAKIAQFRQILTNVKAFIDNVYVPDVLAVAGLASAYASIGKGCGNLLAYGVFDLNSTGSSKLLARGRLTNGSLTTIDTSQIAEYVGSSYYDDTAGTARNPASGVTTPHPGKTGAYSWIKSPRYANTVHEVGPLARMWVNGDYRKGISVIDRIAARALEAQKIANAMGTWLSQLNSSSSCYTYKATPASATGVGLTEAPRGALGHWLQITAGKINSYQIVTPTAWNASPQDDTGKKGPIEQALIGTPIADLTQPIEALRVVHSFDPCLSCAVHMARPGKQAQVVLEL